MAAQQTVGQRFSQLIQALGMSKNAFALSLDKTATVIQHIVEERNKPGFDLLCKVFEIYPNVSKDWLMQGTGSMFPFTTPEATTSSPVAASPALEAPLPTAAPEPEQLTTPLAAPSPELAPVEAPAAPAASVAVPAAPVVEAATVVVPSPAAAPVAAPAAPAANWEAMLYAQQLQHQLALAEQRNQHLLEQQKMMLEQQRMMQQMMEMLRPAR